MNIRNTDNIIEVQEGVFRHNRFGFLF